MSGSDCFSSIREDVKNRPEGKGVRLENCDFVIGPRTFAVFTFYVDYADRSSFKTPPGVIKFSEKKYAIPNQENNTIQLGSFRYYRKHEDDNIADPEEGRLIQRGPFSEICESNGVPSKPWFKYVSSTVTWKRPDILMFCTSALRETQSFGELQSQFPNYDCATLIPDPSKFAMQLGKDVGSKLDMANVHLSGLDRIKQVMLPQAEIITKDRRLKKESDTVVLVSHGPVSYCDPPERIVNHFPIEQCGEVVPFVKRGKFAGHHEYRFAIEVIGEPEDKTFQMEITDELRSLTRPYPVVGQVRNRP